jgi:hypothetical protein
VVDEEYVQEHILTGGNVAPIGRVAGSFMASQHRRKQHTIIGNS